MALTDEPPPTSDDPRSDARADLPRALRELFDPGAGPLPAALRSEVFGPQRFAQHARSLAETHDARRAGWLGSRFFPRLRSNIAMLRRAQRALAECAALGDDVSPASEWLLDNFHVIESQLQVIHEGLPRGYFRSLPVLLDEPLAGLPRIYGVAWAFVAHTDSAFDEDLLVGVLCAYQEVRELRSSEMWALPTTLRVVLVENLGRLAERLATQQAARELANRCCDSIERGLTPALEAMFDAVSRRGAATVFLAQFAQRLYGHGGEGGPPVPAAVRVWLDEVLPNPAAVLAINGAEQTADNLSVSNAVGSLRSIGDADWADVIARSSPLMRRMLTSPLFEAEHHSTRDDTLHAIERWSRRSGRSELEVAAALLACMNTAPEVDPPTAPGAIGASTSSDPVVARHWLDGPGTAAFERALGLQARWHRLGRALARSLALPLYLGIVLGGTALLVRAILELGAPGPTVPAAVWSLWVVAVLSTWPASEAVIALLHRLLGESIPPRRLSRLALRAGIPEQHRVLVTIPAMLTDARSVDALVHRLHLHYLANPETSTQFALLTDWSDSDSARSGPDEPLLAQATQRITELNARHPSGTASVGPRFLLLHRPRRWSTGEGRWIGWERKRGKLEQLVAVLAGPNPIGESPFVDLGPLSRPAAGTRYVVTLDSDTQLPPGRLRELVGVAAHPENRPRASEDGTRIVGGYGILQPRLVTPLPRPEEDTFFHRMFAGQCGIDPYSAASSEIYHDLFREGSFTGKGLLDVQTLHAVLGGRLPEDQVLSHDLLEGAIARCAAVTDISLIEDAPFHAEVAASRVHRWTRGDWQLLPILLRSFVQPSRFPLGALNRWKIADNLRRSLVPPVSLALIVLALAAPAQWGLPPVGGLLALVMAAFVAGPLMGALAGLATSRPAVARLHFYREAGLTLLRAVGGGLWHGAMLLQHALLAVDAIVRALYRVVISHRLLLQWTTAAAAQASASPGLPAALRRRWSVPLVALVIGAGLRALDTPHPGVAIALCLVWGAAPLWSWAASRTGLTGRARPCPPADAAALREIARQTWGYFERTVTRADRYLPPDNLQTDPFDMLAHRTSPTNIGLYLLSAACAREFGWIGTAELARRLDDTLGTLEGLARHRGHFLNWYDTQSGLPLQPMYVSTVDSGNLCAHLLVVAQACLELARQPLTTPEQATALGALAVRCQTLAWAADYTFLYHPRRHLLHIGYRVNDGALDAGFYDLLASESRLTSLLAIAKGDLPVRHWAALGRPFHAAGATAALRSWSGSMFEYLMPTLVLEEPHGSVVRDACVAALIEQRRFADAHGVPWGSSECAHAGRDHTLAYQYAPQGVPRLALRRTPADELVVAPYATALAAQLAPHRAARNFAALAALGARGELGFIEALDYTPARQTGGGRMTRVSTFMAHHQGMTIVALANVLLDGVAQRWGMADPSIEAVGSLLHERAPREVSRLPALPPELPVRRPRDGVPSLQRTVTPGRHAIEPTHLLSNGRYSVALRASGTGRSRWGASDLTRWRDDPLRDTYGNLLWMRRGRIGPLHTLTQHPGPDPSAGYSASFHADRVSLDAAWPALRTRVTVWVSPEDDIEFRAVEVHNLSDETLEIELISTFEPTLADAIADEAHPAFGNLFVTARFDAARPALHFERKPRSVGEPNLHIAHFLANAGPQVVAVGHQVERRHWLGRNRADCAPQGAMQWIDAIDAGGPGGDAGPIELRTGLDPMCALGVRLSIRAGAQAHLTFASAASADAGTLAAVIDKYRESKHVERAALMSTTFAGIRLHGLGMNAETFTVLQSLTTALMFTLARPHASASPLQAFDRRLLWRFGLSGDRPIVLVRIAALSGMSLVRTLDRALRLWAWGGVACDLVVLDAEPASYAMALQHELAALRDRHDADAVSGSTAPGATRSGWHLLRAEALSGNELATLQGRARIVIPADGRSLARHLNDWATQHEADREARSAVAGTALRPSATTHRAANGDAPAPRGSFVSDPARAGEFEFALSAVRRPQRPWINVLANEGFGTHVGEAGGGTTWAGNSRLNQLTPWANDPVADPPSEWLLLQDRRTRSLRSLTPGAYDSAEAVYHVVHGQGFSTMRHRHDGLDLEVDWCVDPVTAIKQVTVTLSNHGTAPRALRLLGVCEWMLGTRRGDRAGVFTASHHAPVAGGSLLALLATQQEHEAGFGGGTAFLAARVPDGGATDDWTCDRRECFDDRGRAVVPDRFGRRHGAGGDPCAALGLEVDLAPGASAQRTLLVGWAADADAAVQLSRQAVEVPPARRMQAARDAWSVLLSATEVETPDPLFDALVNRWLLYQAVGCRLWAKAGFYQAGGATGFRDQLQDSLALDWAAPQMLRAQIVRCASRQYPEGDVQHWWHAPLGAGVRTHFSDDLLWLPYALAHYLRSTGDRSVLDDRVPFLDGPPIPEGSEDLYGTPGVSVLEASVYEHAARTIDRSLRTGVHGLPLMGSGDWNDGMNRVGAGGRGESVWLAWFLCQVVTEFAPIARARGDEARALRWDGAAIGWRTALDGPAWDGEWYRRAFFDDGSPLGSASNTEARIDLIAQAWAVLSGVAPAPRRARALASMRARLVDDRAGLIRLLDPPLADAVPSAGYIQGYPPGVRENGGQYSHAGVWALMAQAAWARTLPESGAALDEAWRHFEYLSPAHRAAHPDRAEVYEAEPYVMAGDVYSAAPYTGRAGWSWYTGAAAWMHRAALGSILGLQIDATHLRIAPGLPRHWHRAAITLRRAGLTMRFLLLRTAPAQALAEAAEWAGDVPLRMLAPDERFAWSIASGDVAFVVPFGDKVAEPTESVAAPAHPTPTPAS